MRIEVNIGGVELAFDTLEGLFSPAHADRGTLAMLSCADLRPGQRVLDLGCGWGLAGVYAAAVCGAQNVVMTDVDPRAVACAQANARLNGLEGVRAYVGDALDAVPDTAFARILVNPPYQSDFSVARKFILKGFNRLEIGGVFYMVTRRRDWYLNKQRSVFGGVGVKRIDGYYVYAAQRRSRQYAQK